MTTPVGNGGVVIDIHEAQARRLRHCSRDEPQAAGSLAAAACTCRVTGRCPTCLAWTVRYSQDHQRRRPAGASAA
jgi:hypothetical protein